MTGHLISALFLIVSMGSALAAPPSGPVDPEMAAWYRGLRQPGSGSGCCSIADCRPYESHMSSDHYEVFIQNRWYPVPNEVVIHGENKAGSAVACLRTQWFSEEVPANYSPGIMCFIPGPAT